jgi:hypothetical protein
MEVEVGVLFLAGGGLAAEVGRVAGEFVAERLAGQWVVGQPAMMDVFSLTGELHHSIETRKQIPACMALQRNETKDETALEKRLEGRYEDRRQVWWLSPDDRKWLRFPDRYQLCRRGRSPWKKPP